MKYKIFVHERRKKAGNQLARISPHPLAVKAKTFTLTLTVQLVIPLHSPPPDE